MFCELLMKEPRCYPLRSGIFLIAEDGLHRGRCKGDKTISRRAAQRKVTRRKTFTGRLTESEDLQLLANVKGVLAASKRAREPRTAKQTGCRLTWNQKVPQSRIEGASSPQS
ncbi:hypothetical protein CPLU01_06932 [Colletotrichum plurivorum]|uniref:Uncharacterized protein n=1 Tax=Colletotrichum plurivorum TaxID=2175906 RepID=A0A8H6NF49_9PEZI|nr:hypothetical protein CPLU01_06932 [Colletotrichum plurivorum]